MIPVKLPKQVLNLFPSWEYRCPSCGTYVDSNISFCPTCKTSFHEKLWRVPPRFLKNRDAMSEYAHKVLAPKLTSEQRELLFQYFTELFNDGFDPHADFSAWTGTSVGANVTFEVSAESPHCGTYGVKVDLPLGYIDESAYCYYVGSLGSYDTVHVRWYVKVTASDLDAEVNRRFGLGGFSDGNGRDLGVLRVKDYNNDGSLDLELAYRDGSDYIFDSIQTELALNTWHCLEIKRVEHATSGEYHVWVDGVSAWNPTELDTDNYAHDRIIIGSKSGYNTLDSYATYYFDCVIVADTSIGPESSEQTYTKTWATDALFKKLGITPEFSVDAALQKQDISATFGVDSAFQKRFSIQKQVSALFKSFDIQKNFGLDTYFGGMVTRFLSSQVDAVFKKLNASTAFGLDVYFGTLESGAYEKTFGLTALFAYKVMLPELWLDENGKLVFNISKPYAWVGI